MNRRLMTFLCAAVAVCGLSGMTAQAQTDFDTDLSAIRDRWAIIKYQTPEDQREAAFETLTAQAAALTTKYPRRAEALIWEGIVLSTYAGAKGGLGALGIAKQARDKLEAALAIDENALEGSAHTSLGTLYHGVPGFPVGFGSDKKARMHLEKALQINANGIDQNYFFGEFLYDEGEYAQALQHLEKALKAPPRPGRQVADEGRRGEIRALMARTRKELG